MALTPESIKKDLTAEQFRLYKLIWSRFLACQMANAIYDSVNIEVTSAGYVFKASRSEVKFPGFLAVYEEGKDEEGGEIQSRLPNLQEGEPLVKTADRPEQKFTQPPRATPRPPSSGRWRRRALAAPLPTRPPSPPL